MTRDPVQAPVGNRRAFAARIILNGCKAGKPVAWLPRAAGSSPVPRGEPPH